MPNAVDKVSDEALALPADARIALVDRLLESLNLPAQPEIERLWTEEAERRAAEMERGEVAPVPGGEVYSEIRRKHAR
ncbi:MAG: addiction module protein [Candidatus Hydrogenedens sp.]|nr:addiction module protein [Candidatus Hydrogenedens sp.]